MSARCTVQLTIGGVHASAEPALLKTLLGSCIAVCLWDEAARVGGMNHFMLPLGEAGGGDPGRFGVHAMDLLIGAIQRAGGQRGRLVAKLFGGGAVLASVLTAGRVPERNIEFIDRFMRLEGIPVQARDVGGTQARQVQFLTDTGQAFVKRLGAVQQRQQARIERKLMKPRPTAQPAYGEIELWT